MEVGEPVDLQFVSVLYSDSGSVAELSAIYLSTNRGDLCASWGIWGTEQPKVLWRIIQDPMAALF